MKQSGFTLVEMVVVIAIAGILLAIATLQFNSWTAKYDIESEIKQMYADMTEARMRAMGSNRFRFVVLTATQYTVYDDQDCNGLFETPPPPPAVPPDPVSLQVSTSKNPLTWSPAGNTPISFDQNGIASGPTSTDTTISIANSVGAAYDCISITQTKTTLGKMNGTVCIPQ